MKLNDRKMLEDQIRHMDGALYGSMISCTWESRFRSLLAMRLKG